MYNSPNLPTCITCANPLYTGDNSDKEDAHCVPCDTIMHPIAGSTYVMCGMCGRVNVSDARFCDWCGSRVSVKIGVNMKSFKSSVLFLSCLCCS